MICLPHPVNITCLFYYLGELDDIEKPPPVHYGVDAAIRSGSVALKTGNGHHNHGNGNLSASRKQANHFLSNESLTTIIKEPSLARGQSQESVVNVRVTSPHSEGRKSTANSTSPQISPQSKKIIPLRNGHDSGKFVILLLTFIIGTSVKI